MCTGLQAQYDSGFNHGLHCMEACLYIGNSLSKNHETIEKFGKIPILFVRKVVQRYKIYVHLTFYEHMLKEHGKKIVTYEQFVHSTLTCANQHKHVE